MISDSFTACVLYCVLALGTEVHVLLLLYRVLQLTTSLGQNILVLCIMIRSSRQFAVDLHYMKSKFYKSFNSVFHRADRLKNDLVTFWSNLFAGHTCCMLLSAWA